MVSGWGPPAYLDEFEFRFNNRHNEYLSCDTLKRLVEAEEKRLRASSLHAGLLTNLRGRRIIGFSERLGLADMTQVLPSGVITIMFTNLVGSTALADRLGDEAARALLRAHDRILREQFERFDGQVVMRNNTLRMP